MEAATAQRSAVAAWRLGAGASEVLGGQEGAADRHAATLLRTHVHPHSHCCALLSVKRTVIHDGTSGDRGGVFSPGHGRGKPERSQSGGEKRKQPFCHWVA